MSGEELTITAEYRRGRVFLTVEHGNAERVQVLELAWFDMLAAMATAENAIATKNTAAAHYPRGLIRGT